MAEGGINQPDSSTGRSIVDWNVIPNCRSWQDADSLGCGAGLEIVTQVQGAPYIVDEVIEEDVRIKLLADINSTFTTAKPWSEGKKVPLAVEDDAPFVGYEWIGADGCSRMQCWKSEEFSNELLLYKSGDFAILVGSACCHPIIRCTTFTYMNSDGSHEAHIPAGTSTTAEELLEWMLKETGNYCMNWFH